jgi:hypothetical protein
MTTRTLGPELLHKMNADIYRFPDPNTLDHLASFNSA